MTDEDKIEAVSSVRGAPWSTYTNIGDGGGTSTATYTMPSIKCNRCDCMYVQYDYITHYCDAYALQAKFGQLLMKYPYAEITITASGWEIKIYE